MNMTNVSLTLYSYPYDRKLRIKTFASFFFNKVRSQADTWNRNPKILLNVDSIQRVSSDVFSIFWGWMRLKEVDWKRRVPETGNSNNNIFIKG